MHSHSSLRMLAVLVLLPAVLQAAPKLTCNFSGTIFHDTHAFDVWRLDSVSPRLLRASSLNNSQTADIQLQAFAYGDWHFSTQLPGVGPVNGTLAAPHCDLFQFSTHSFTEWALGPKPAPLQVSHFVERLC